MQVINSVQREVEQLEENFTELGDKVRKLPPLKKISFLQIKIMFFSRIFSFKYKLGLSQVNLKQIIVMQEKKKNLGFL